MSLLLSVLPEATAQIQSTPLPELDQPSTAPPANGTAAPSPAVDPLGIFAPPSPDGQGAQDPLAPAGSEPSGTPAIVSPLPGQGAGGQRPGGGSAGAGPSAFGSVKEFSSELGIRQLIDPNSPDFQPLNTSDFLLVRPQPPGQPGRKSFRLSEDRTGPIREDTNHRERFARALIQPARTLAPASRRADRRQEGSRMAWPAIQSVCPDADPGSGSTGYPSCPG